AVSACPTTTPRLVSGLAGFWGPPLEGAMKLAGPPNLPRSISWYLVCCAASGIGIASAVSRAIAVSKIKVLDFIRSPFLWLLTAGASRGRRGIHVVIDLLLCLALLVLARFVTPVDGPRFDVRHRQ